MPSPYVLTFDSQQWHRVTSANLPWNEMDTVPLMGLLRRWKEQAPGLTQVKLTKSDPPAVNEWVYLWKMGADKWKQTMRLADGAWTMNFACDFFKESDFLPGREARAEIQRLIWKFDVTSIVCDWP